MLTTSMHGQVEKLLAEAEGARKGAPRKAGSLEHHCQLLERLAGEVARLHYNTARGQVGLPLLPCMLSAACIVASHGSWPYMTCS